MKKRLIRFVAAAFAGLFLLSGCDVLPKGTDGPRDVPLTIKADFTQKEKAGNWIKYGDCKITTQDGKALVTNRKESNAGVAISCPDY